MVAIKQPRPRYSNVIRLAVGILLLVVALSPFIRLQKLHLNNSEGSVALERSQIVGRLEKLQPIGCQKTLQDPNIHDPNKELGPDFVSTRFTITDPPFWISLHNKWFDKMRWAIMKEGEYYEKGVTKLFHDVLSSYNLKEHKQTPLVLDIGMNIGWFTLYSRAHGYNVASFEPNPVMFLRVCESLQKNVWDDSSVTLWHYGLGAEAGVFNLTTGKNKGGSSFYEDRLAKKFRSSIAVPVVTLDSVAIQQGWLDRKIVFMKIDVEGFENNVVKGGRRLFYEGHVENLLMENSIHDATTVGQMMDTLYDAGFRIKEILTVNGYPYHEDWWSTFNPMLEERRKEKGVSEASEQIEFLATVTCNVWWVNSKYREV